jgi:hypothetical protein
MGAVVSERRASRRRRGVDVLDFRSAAVDSDDGHGQWKMGLQGGLISLIAWTCKLQFECAGCWTMGRYGCWTVRLPGSYYFFNGSYTVKFCYV